MCPSAGIIIIIIIIIDGKLAIDYLYKRNRVDNGAVHVKTHLEVMLYLRLHATHWRHCCTSCSCSVPIFKAISILTRIQQARMGNLYITIANELAS